MQTITFEELKKEYSEIMQKYQYKSELSDEENAMLDAFDEKIGKFIETKYPKVKDAIGYAFPDWSDIEYQLDTVTSEKDFIYSILMEYCDDLLDFFDIDLDAFFNEYYNKCQVCHKS